MFTRRTSYSFKGQKRGFDEYENVCIFRAKYCCEHISYLKQTRVSSMHLYTDLSRSERPSEGEQETKKIKMPTTLSAEKKRNDLKKQE